MAQQTSVEWLINWMSANQYFIGNDLLEAVEQAKEMEKEQIIDAYEEAWDISYALTGEEYYNETFKK